LANFFRDRPVLVEIFLANFWGIVGGGLARVPKPKPSLPPTRCGQPLGVDAPLPAQSAHHRLHSTPSHHPSFPPRAPPIRTTITIGYTPYISNFCALRKLS
jgi:hypothetical protein